MILCLHTKRAVLGQARFEINSSCIEPPVAVDRWGRARLEQLFQAGRQQLFSRSVEARQPLNGGLCDKKPP